MKILISCAYNMDIACVELKFSAGSMIAIDTIAVESCNRVYIIRWLKYGGGIIQFPATFSHNCLVLKQESTIPYGDFIS